MKEQMGRWVIILVTAHIVIVIWVVGLPAGEWHTGSDLVCAQCHVIHYSEGGGGEPGGPFTYLLSHSTINGLCLSCHDGSDATAPDVFAAVTMYDAGGDEHSAAGYFAGTDVGSDSAHNLGITDLVPLRTPSTNMALSCASCHDVHGNSNYRNLVSDPDTSGSGTNLVLGTDIFEGVAPAVPPTQEGSAAAYKSSNIGYRSNLSSWCAECHNLLATNENGVTPAHYKRHPSDVSLNAAGSHTDPSNWVAGDSLGFGAATGDGTEGVPRVRFQVATATDYSSAKTVASANQVFCTSCHLAHGGEYLSCAVWPYKVLDADMYSPCQQCHNQ